ncbi:MAG: hydrolase [Bdellovibrionales bacterium RIFOXYB1_FULL_37_110]|nr:MAG: hydrolase [Bdellovibrionales bacterium RIFOXYA1_FULL_38_20]OFZ50125.1 MAG: hydrolase [Bdellovibrionales bacterium RIFOXYC1_FULL_37_79]OFZ60031.1 MAG: hydrolase [Bdellovibrionales bacterium RIFOXYB1_FULL_37_110]OFZ64246.1 MAG: hydrolase [Bdellovibrionales bacterium RIFOXYD1_FULL_36_51]
MNLITDWAHKFETYLTKNHDDDGSHDVSHFKRVWKTAQKLMTEETDELVILASCYFHDIVCYPKNHPKRSCSSREAALKAEKILLAMNFPTDKIENIKHCIEAHSFSANIPPQTMEAKIVQDADRMEALGAIGLARVFYVAGQLGQKLFDDIDPFAHKRNFDDKKYALDHFNIKLLKLPETMQTEKGKDEANKRKDLLLRFMDDLQLEL